MNKLDMMKCNQHGTTIKVQTNNLKALELNIVGSFEFFKLVSFCVHLITLFCSQVVINHKVHVLAK